MLLNEHMIKTQICALLLSRTPLHGPEGQQFTVTEEVVLL